MPKKQGKRVDLPPIKVAIVHDWLVGGGAERVVQALHKIFPEAPIYTSYATPEWRARLDGKVITGFLQHWPFSRLRKFVGVLRMWWFSRLDFSGYDLVISSSGNGEALGVRPPKGTTYICYCHTPTHYYWRHYEHYLKQPGFGIFDPLARLGLRLLVGPLRRWDWRAAQRPDVFIANSTHIQKDIKHYYGREAIVIHPPIDTDRFMSHTPQERAGFLTVGRQVPAKRTDIIVEACTRLNLPLTVVGRGPEHERLKKLAGTTVTFAPPSSDEDVVRYMQRAEAFIFASHDDSGIAPVEALAAGTPVIAYKAGGALDYIAPGKTGLFFAEQTVDSLVEVLQQFDSTLYDHEAIAAYAAQFSVEQFSEKIKQLICSLFPE